MNKQDAPIIIGIAGRSCCGKTAVISNLEQKYKGKIIHIDQDKFYKKNPKNQERPESLRYDKIIGVIKLLKNGKPAYIPSHKFTEKFDRKIEPHKLVIIGGHLLFVDKRLNQLFDKKIWMDVSDLNLLYRRLKKFNVFNNSNKKTYKKYFGEVSQLDYTVKVVIPESKRYENIQRKAADFVVDGNLPPKKLLANVEKLIKISFKDV